MRSFKKDGRYGRGFDPVEAGIKMKSILKESGIGDTWRKKSTGPSKNKPPENKNPDHGK